jgi:hypothetical protein
MRITTLEVSIHSESESPVFGELVTRVRIEDEGGGEFITITQNRDDGSNEIRLDFSDVPYLLEAIEALKRGITNEPEYPDDRPR